MSSAGACWGIHRETAHSPGRIDDDAAILARVADALRARHFVVTLLGADEADRAFATPAANIFAMCERDEILRRLDDAVCRGAVVVNAPHAIANTYRHRMIERFAAHSVPAPESRIVATVAPPPRPWSRAWIKRSDFHATEAGDVIHAASETEWRAALERFAARGFPSVVAQEHVEGELVKFYGVGGGAVEAPRAAWFECFRHADKGKVQPLEAAHLRDAALRAAVALGVEIFGGDAILGADGRSLIIDLNAWPSYALYRDAAAAAIADHLAGRFLRRSAVATATEYIHG